MFQDWVTHRFLTAAKKRKRKDFTGGDDDNKQEAADVDTKHCGKGLNGCRQRRGACHNKSLEKIFKIK